MTGERRDETVRALRSLASPLTVASLVLLVLNDHVLKQAWPGWVTGKLSDVVGLVVAPLVLAVPLALLRVPRPAFAAVLATGVGFSLVKTTSTGASVASDLWSAVAGPSYLMRDPTDLLALPALLVALRVHRLAGVPRRPLRQRATATAGAVVLPFAVLATAATSPCDAEGFSVGVAVLEGRWEAGRGPAPVESRLVYDGDFAIQPTETGPEIQVLSASQRERVVDWGERLQLACDPATPRLCWGEREAASTSLELESSRDGGRTWTAEEAMTAQEVAAVRAEVGEVCGEPLEIRVDDIAVLSTEDGPFVAAAVGRAGVVVRDLDGQWDHLSPDEVRSRAVAPDPPPEDDQLVPVEEAPPPALGVSTGPSPLPSGPASPSGPPCEDPVTVSVTPHPSNGPPTSYLQCDIASGP